METRVDGVWDSRLEMEPLSEFFVHFIAATLAHLH